MQYKKNKALKCLINCVFLCLLSIKILSAHAREGHLTCIINNITDEKLYITTESPLIKEDVPRQEIGAGGTVLFCINFKESFFMLQIIHAF